MSETTAYLIPKKHFEVGEFEGKIKIAFEKLKFINGFYDEDSNWFAAGDNAHLLFADGSLEDNPPFEYVEIHDTENNRLLPEGLQESVECKVCCTDVKEEVNDLLFTITEMEYDAKKEIDMATAEFLCPKCGQRSKFSELTYHEKTAITGQFICFVAILDKINTNKLADIERQIDSQFDIIYGSI
jgi:hypothetical protein